MTVESGTRHPAPRKVTEVAVGVLLRADDAVLLADRPDGKPYAGYWEFPGGKVEPGESVEHALERELHEELGVDIGESVPWVTFEFDYPHAYVRLHFRRIYDWHGTPRGREGQRLAFFRLHEPAPQPLLPAAVPALRWLSLPALIADMVLDERSADRQLAQLEQALARGVRMVSLRAPATLPLDALRALMRQVQIRAESVGALVTVSASLGSTIGHDREVKGALSVLLQDTEATDARPDAHWVGLRAADRGAVQRAADLGFDYAVVGPVLPDPTSSQKSIGWHGFDAIAQQAPLPIYASGGLDLVDFDRARRAGAQGLMVRLSAW